MLEEKNKTEELDSELNTEIDKKLSILPLNTKEQTIVANIINAESKDELQAQFDLFNMNQSKKNALRIIKLNTLLDKVEDQALERMTKRPDMVSNKELLDYMNVVSNQIERSQKQIDSLKDTPSITLKQQNNTEVNINVGPQLDREGKERVIDAISSLIKQLNQTPPDDVVDVTDSSSPEDISETENVYIDNDNVLEEENLDD